MEANKKIIEYNLDFYLFDQDPFEPDEIFHSRVWYILGNLDTKDTVNELIKKSRILSNIEQHECEYNFDI
jgi:hypothetical protein